MPFSACRFGKKSALDSVERQIHLLVLIRCRTRSDSLLGCARCSVDGPLAGLLALNTDGRVVVCREKYEAAQFSLQPYIHTYSQPPSRATGEPQLLFSCASFRSVLFCRLFCASSFANSVAFRFVARNTLTTMTTE